MGIEQLFVVPVAVIIVLCILGSLMFGKLNAKFRCGSIIVAAVLAFVVTLIVKGNIATESVFKGLIQALQGSGSAGLAELAEQLLPVGETLMSVLGAIIAPVLFLVFFIVFYVLAFVVSVIVWIGKVIAYAASEEKKKNGKFTRLVTGVISGLVIVVCILVPVSAYADVAAIAIPELEANGIIDDSGLEEQIADINNSTPITVFRKAGGDFLVTSLTTIDIKDEDYVTKTTVNVEAENLIKLYSHITLLSGVEIKDYSEAEADAILAVGEDLASSKLISRLAGDLIYTATDAWKNGNAFIGVEKPSLGETFDPVFDEIINISNNDAKNTTYLGEDITTISHLIAEMAKSGVFTKLDGEPMALLGTLTDDGVIDSIIFELNNNARMKRIIPVVSNIGFKIIGDTIGIPENKTEVYDNMMSEVAGELNSSLALPEAERVTSITNKIMANTKNAGMTICETEAHILATGLAQYFADDTDVTAEEVTQFFAEISEAMAKEDATENVGFTGEISIGKLNGKNKKDTSDATAKLLKKIYQAANIENEDARKNAIKNAVNNSELFENVSAEAKEILQDTIVEFSSKIDVQELANSLENITSLSSSEKATEKITTVTMDDIKFDPDAYMNSSATTEELTKNMTDVFKCAAKVADALTSLDGGNSEGSLEQFSEVTEALGGILDTLAKEESYGKDKAHDLFAAVITSSIVTESTGISKEDTQKIVDSTTEISDYTSLVGAVTQMGSVVNGVQNNDVNSENIVELIKHLNRENIVLVDTLVTPDTIAEFGIKSDKADEAAKIIHKVFHNLADITDESAFATEAEAVKHLLELAAAASELKDDEMVFGENGKLKCTALELIEYIYNSSAVKDALEYSETELGSNPMSLKLGNADIAILTEACEQFIANNPSADARAFVEAINVFFGVNEDAE